MSNLTDPIAKAAVLIEALPYLQRFRGQTILVKIGGSAMDRPELIAQHLRDIVFLELVGFKPIVVHGGGKAISQAMATSGIETKFINGLRYTCPATIDLVSRTLGEEISPSLVGSLREFGGNAIAIGGPQVFVGERITTRTADGVEHELGRVGQVIACNVSEIEQAIAANIVPVVSPLASEFSTQKLLNINADLAAAALAKALRVNKLLFLSDVPGLLSDLDDPASLIHSIDSDRAEELIATGVIAGGMLPKVRAALAALSAGVRKVHFIDGRTPHTLLLEIFTSQGIGTEITR